MDPRFFVVEQSENDHFKILEGFIPGESAGMVALGIGSDLNRYICQIDWIMANEALILNFDDFFEFF